MDLLNLSCIIIEDEAPAAEVLKYYISQNPSLTLVGSFRSANSSLEFLKTNEVDLIFLDICLPGISGVSFLKKLKNPPDVIFTTAFTEYAVDGFELEAVDYLIKPISPGRFEKAVARLQRLRSHRMDTSKNETGVVERQFVFVKCEKRMVKIFLEDVLYFEAQKNYLNIETLSGTYTTYHSLSEMEEKLPENKFLRIHRSFIVSLKHIESYSNHQITINKKSLSIGRLFSQNSLSVLKTLNQLK